MVDGKYYAVSYQPVIETIFYNKDLFTQYNVELPTTWDEMVEACKVFKDLSLIHISSTAEECAAASEELASQAQLLKELAGKFRLTDINDRKV